MNAVCLQKTVHCTGDLALEIIHDNYGRCVISSGLTNMVDVRDDDLLYGSWWFRWTSALVSV